MKLSLFAFLASVAILASCKKDNISKPQVISVTALNGTVVNGNWRIANFFDQDHDATALFTGYNFTFAANGVVTASKTGSVVTGGWSSGNDDSDIKLVLLFTGPGNFSELNYDWHVVERTDTKISLQDISNGGGGTETLTLEKN